VKITAEIVEALILEAAQFDRRSPMVRAPGYSKFWPTIFYDPIDWGFHAQQLTQLGVAGVGMEVVEKWVSGSERVAPRKDVYDLVMLKWLGPQCCLKPPAKRVVWLRLGRGSRLSWRKVAVELHCSHEKARQMYDNSLKLLVKQIDEKMPLTDQVL
jgi:hypothetical protein